MRESLAKPHAAIKLNSGQITLVELNQAITATKFAFQKTFRTIELWIYAIVTQLPH
jgi:hypothetical protein